MRGLAWGTRVAFGLALVANACGDSDSPVDASGSGTTGTTGVMMADDSGTTRGTGATDTGSGGGSADETGDPACTVATAAEDCDDGDPCTHDQCDVGGTCINETWPDDTACDAGGMAGSCQAGECVVECSGNADCNDDNACTVESCDLELGVCDRDELDGIDAPVGAQTAGDCTVLTCVDGTEVGLADDNDTENDSNPCTVDTCSRGTPVHNPSIPGTICGGGDGVCDGEGNCVECISPDDCDQFPVDNDCQTRTCVAGVCGQAFADQGTEVNATLQTPNDCEVVVCDGAGGTEVVDDDADVPFDGMECTDDVCTNGVPSNPPTMAAEPCAAGVCDGFGTCVGCNVPADCGGTNTFCQQITCISNMCGVNNAMYGLVLPPFSQTANNCQLAICDGAGAVTALEDPTDLPLPDGNDCTTEACANGVALFPDLPINTLCDDGGGSFCDGAGNCVECNNAAQCSGAGQCQVDACQSNTCGFAPDVPGTPCNNGLFCDGVDSCDSMGACIGAGDPCPGPDGDANCSESCNEATDTCNLDDPAMSPCQDGQFCTTGDTCDGNGTCEGGGPTCPGPDGDFDCSESCDEGANNCNAIDTPGSACNDFFFCTVTDTCNAAGLCVGTGNPCPGADNDGDCSESCNEFQNNCTANDPSGSVCNDGQFCTATDTCNASGSCVGAGNPCVGPDGDGNCSESCDETLNNCSGNDPVGSSCTDGQFCTSNDQCNSDGACEGGPNPCDGVDGDGDCTEQCDETANNCQGQDPNGSICDPGGIFGGICTNGLCVGI